MLVANIKIWKSYLNIREGSDYLPLSHCAPCLKIKRIFGKIRSKRKSSVIKEGYSMYFVRQSSFFLITSYTYIIMDSSGASVIRLHDYHA